MQPRRVARELALLGLSQVSPATDVPLAELILAAVRALTQELEDTLEQASSSLKRAHQQLGPQADFTEAMEATRTAINHLGTAAHLPEWVYLAGQAEVQAFAQKLLQTWHSHQAEIDDLLQRGIKGWQIQRLHRMERDILRLGTAELVFLATPVQVVMNEAVELGKRYCGEDSHRFINGTLRQIYLLHQSETPPAE
ncbi:transcription antitermination factor NusB, putative [Gloeomargarita lithophora Alchichica-D10]|uniref:Transcription antitermination protein NusB n=1 Tax=Gloeomargarita lithophora Alchichica-D10 TaxID=1188229 RepID=A0A1J0AGI0_9CYAN|nr:transcription antitermination factor NusB [Gloeomargarita lithophora]APB34995.1 transcription antitermination factor NusB, putative [Gloeomargarita lithophora Alchichica-D10]